MRLKTTCIHRAQQPSRCGSFALRAIVDRPEPGVARSDMRRQTCTAARQLRTRQSRKVVLCATVPSRNSRRPPFRSKSTGVVIAVPLQAAGATACPGRGPLQKSAESGVVCKPVPAVGQGDGESVGAAACSFAGTVRNCREREFDPYQYGDIRTTEVSKDCSKKTFNKV